MHFLPAFCFGVHVECISNLFSAISDLSSTWAVFCVVVIIQFCHHLCICPMYSCVCPAVCHAHFFMYPLLPVLTHSFFLSLFLFFDISHSCTFLWKALRPPALELNLWCMAPQVPQQGTCLCLQLCMQTQRQVITFSGSCMIQRSLLCTSLSSSC